jgi:hypothetical protein
MREQREMIERLRGLAALEPRKFLVLSVYLDMRPQATGERPALRAGLVLLKDRLREIEKTLWPRGPALDSFRSDKARIERYLEEEFPVSAQGLAIFACAGQGLFETFEVGMPFEDQVVARPVPDLFQLARLVSQLETTLVALVDTNTARLFVTRRGFFDEVSGLDDDSVHYQRRRTGALNQERYQRHIDKHRADFAKEAAAEIERVVQAEGATRLILIGDAVAVPLLHNALSTPIANLLHDEILRADIRTRPDQLQREIDPLLAEVQAEESLSLADQLITEVQTSGLGVLGLEETRTALTHGQVDVLLLEASAPLDEAGRSDLIRLAATTSADVEIVEQHPLLSQSGGVGALLRYRHEGPVHAAA